MDITKIDSHIKKSIKFLAFFAAAVPAVYIWWFWIMNPTPISLTADAWGEFGDYVGGILNPIIAFSAFYWLATAVKLQKAELSDTKKALIATQKAQEEQAKIALAAARMQNINLQLEVINSHIISERAYLNHLIQQAQTLGSQFSVITRTGENKNLDEVLPGLNEYLNDLTKKQADLIIEAERISQ